MLLLDVDTNCITVCRMDETTMQCSHKKTYFCSLYEVVQEYLYEPDHHLLLPETAYIFHTIHIEYACHEPFTISMYKKLLQEKKEALVAEHACNPLHMIIVPFIANELGEGSIKHILWKTGKFAWTWYMYALSPDMVLMLQQAYGSFLSAIISLPRNLALIRSFVKILHHDSFTVLTLTDQGASLCEVKNWWYHQLATAPLWLHILLEATEDQWVQKYLFRDHEDLQHNSIAKKLLLESLWFYASAVAERVGSFVLPWSHLVLCCHLVVHELFTEILQSTLQTKGVFVLPFASLPSSNWQKKWMPLTFALDAYTNFCLSQKI